jgi:hypothetical protein
LALAALEVLVAMALLAERLLLLLFARPLAALEVLAVRAPMALVQAEH